MLRDFGAAGRFRQGRGLAAIPPARSSQTAAATVVVSGCAVTPAAPFTRTRGSRASRSSPTSPRTRAGWLSLFHGSNGSANFAERVETTAVLNLFIVEGLRVRVDLEHRAHGRSPLGRLQPVAHRRTPTSLALCRLHAPARRHHAAHVDDAARRHRHVQRVALRHALGPGLEERGPIPSRRSGRAMGRIAVPGGPRPGALTVPTVFSTAENDFTSPPGPIIIDFNTTRNAGTPAALHISRERKLSAQPLPADPGRRRGRGPPISTRWSARRLGRRGDANRRQRRGGRGAGRRGAAPGLRGGGSQRGREPDRAQLAVHQFTAEFALTVAAFFDRYVPAANRRRCDEAPCPCLDRDRRAGVHELRRAATPG